MRARGLHREGFFVVEFGMRILFELLRLHGGTGSFGGDLSRFSTNPIEVPMDDGEGFRFWARRFSSCQPGFTLTAAIYPEFHHNRIQAQPALQFWLLDGPGCHRDLVPFHFFDSSKKRAEYFAEFPVGAVDFRVYDPVQFEGLRHYADLWDEELRQLGLVERYRGLQSVG